MLNINLENVANQVKSKGFEETTIGFKKTLNQGTLPIKDQLCFRRITLLSEYISNLDEKGLDFTNITPISNPKIHKDFQIKVKNSAVVTKLITKYPELFQDFELIKSTLDDVFLAVTKSKPGTDISELKNSKTKAE